MGHAAILVPINVTPRVVMHAMVKQQVEKTIAMAHVSLSAEGIVRVHV